MRYVTNYDVPLYLLLQTLQREWDGVSLKEQVHFIEIAYGSLNEVMCQLELSEELGYITIKDLQNLEVQYEEIARMLSGLRNSKMRTLT